MKAQKSMEQLPIYFFQKKKKNKSGPKKKFHGFLEDHNVKPFIL